jgi:hypothetical protein
MTVGDRLKTKPKTTTNRTEQRPRTNLRLVAEVDAERVGRRELELDAAQRVIVEAQLAELVAERAS